MTSEYLYSLYNSLKRKLEDIGGGELEEYYAYCKGLIEELHTRDLYRIKEKAYDKMAEVARGEVLIYEGGLGLLPYLSVMTGGISKETIILEDDEFAEILREIYSKLHLKYFEILSGPLEKVRPEGKYDYVIFSEALSLVKVPDKVLDRAFSRLKDSGKILIFDLNLRALFEEVEDWAIRNGMRSRTIISEKVRLGGRSVEISLREYYFLERRKSRYVKAGIFLIRP